MHALAKAHWFCYQFSTYILIIFCSTYQLLKKYIEVLCNEVRFFSFSYNALHLYFNYLNIFSIYTLKSLELFEKFTFFSKDFYCLQWCFLSKVISIKVIQLYLYLFSSIYYNTELILKTWDIFVKEKFDLSVVYL